ncbi:hes family bHLH transcription factor 5 S homeolog [Xenopus laevis]|nr:hes family bHLH transcription factor 5 S homeolog [Xenopus laevis]BAD95802.1 enhancer of split related protein 1b [Xenopus laevis]
MAPTNISLDTFSSKEKNKLRKPIVEKMRRDRINNSIEQLKLLLGKEFHEQEPNVKLEKADILEKAVSYLQQQTSQSPNLAKLEQDYKQGFSCCLKEAVQFLCYYPENGETQMKLLNHLQAPQRLSVAPHTYIPSVSDSKQVALASTTNKIWRPW